MTTDRERADASRAALRATEARQSAMLEARLTDAFLGLDLAGQLVAVREFLSCVADLTGKPAQHNAPLPPP